MSGNDACTVRETCLPQTVDFTVSALYDGTPGGGAQLNLGREFTPAVTGLATIGTGAWTYTDKMVKGEKTSAYFSGGFQLELQPFRNKDSKNGLQWVLDGGIRSMLYSNKLTDKFDTTFQTFAGTGFKLTYKAFLLKFEPFGISKQLLNLGSSSAPLQTAYRAELSIGGNFDIGGSTNRD